MLETTRLLQDLVALPSVNPMGRPLEGPEIYEHQVTAYLEAFFSSLAVRQQRQAIAPRRDNILAWFDPPGATRTLVWEVHQDTVPTDQMTIDPFAALVEGDRLSGRGACDIKGGMASMLAAFARLVREQPRGGARVLLACTVDEEFTFLGVQRLVQDLRASATDQPWRSQPIQAIVAEPTNLNIVNAHKGAVRWDLITRGRSCHSSRPELGINAIYRMAGVLPHVDEYARTLSAARQHPRLGPATLSVGRIEGGTSVNTVPDSCRIEIDRRLLPGEDPDEAQKELIAYLQQRLGEPTPFEACEPRLRLPALGSEGSLALVAELAEAIDKVKGSHQVHAVPYGTDASPLASAGIPAVVFGPGSIEQAHTCDEWVPLDEVAQAAEILYEMARGGPGEATD
jgi:acetylornithine deacetylase/succinyl-diaminopimelate desuccinylase-like protein